MSSFDTESETPEFENLTSLAENIVYRLPGCTDLMVRKAIQDVYRDFCRRSCCLRGRRHFQLDAGQNSFAAAPMVGEIVDAVALVKYDGMVLREPKDFSVTKGRSPVVFLAPRWVPSAETDSGNLPHIEVDTVEIPALNSEQTPSWFIDRFGEVICSGVFSRLMAMTNKPWSDAQQATDERLKYENAVNEERTRYYAQSSNGDMGCAIDYSDLI